MRKIPNFVLLRAFEAAARLESFTLAAGELALTPSAISHQVRELEEVLGKSLFVRLHRRVELTAEGRRFATGLTRVLDALEASCAEVRLAPSSQVLSLYCAPTFAVKWLGPRLVQFAKAFPQITIRMTSGADPMDLARAREIDLAISYGTAVRRPGVEVISLGKETIAPLCSPSLIGKGQSARDVIGTTTLIDSPLSQVSWRDWFTLNGIEMPARSRQSFDRAALSISAAVDGMGIALESTRLAERELARGDLVQVGTAEFMKVLRETHFLSHRVNEGHVEKIAQFKGWLLGQLPSKTRRKPNATVA
jgi:LysR family glycine cleavage system transcriptional activator